MLASSRNWEEGCKHTPPTNILQVYAHTHVYTILNVTTEKNSNIACDLGCITIV